MSPARGIPILPCGCTNRANWLLISQTIHRDKCSNYLGIIRRVVVRSMSRILLEECDIQQSPVCGQNHRLGEARQILAFWRGEGEECFENSSRSLPFLGWDTNFSRGQTRRTKGLGQFSGFFGGGGGGGAVYNLPPLTSSGS